MGTLNICLSVALDVVGLIFPIFIFKSQTHWNNAAINFVLTLEQVKDNLQLVADGFRFKYEDPSSSNAIELNIGVMEKTFDELKWLFSRIEGTSPENWGLDAIQEENSI